MAQTHPSLSLPQLRWRGAPLSERHYRVHWGELRKIEAEIVNSGFVGDALRRRMGPQIATLKAAMRNLPAKLSLAMALLIRHRPGAEDDSGRGYEHVPQAKAVDGA